MSLAVLVVGPRDLETYRLAEHPFEWRHVPVRRPQLELRIAGRAQAGEIVVAARIEIDAGERLGVAAVEALGEAYRGGERFDGAADGTGQIAVAFVRFLGRALAMVAGNEGDGLDLLRIEAAQIAVLDQVVGMPVMALVADVHADIVQQRAVFEPVTLVVAETMHATRLIEHGQRQARHVLRMLRPVTAPLADSTTLRRLTSG